MQQESAEQNNLEYLYDIICRHESGGVNKPFAPVVEQEAQINTKMHQQECYKE
jgi:hypothetical protein